MPFEVIFDKKSKTDFFDLDEMPSKTDEKKVWYDGVLRQVSGWVYPENRFRYVSRGIRADKD